MTNILGLSWARLEKQLKSIAVNDRIRVDLISRMV
jgi:hypothetical protein